MRDYYCLDVSFPKVDFDVYELGSEKVKSIHHAHLYSKENEIELRIFFEPQTSFDRKFSHWAGSINWGKFGSYVTPTNEKQNHSLQKIDLTHSSLLWVEYVGGDHSYLALRIDFLKFYWDPNPEQINTAEFFLNKLGFKVVKGFYAPLWEFDGKFEISRMNGKEDFYPLGKGAFRPEFSFELNDNKNVPEATIIKNPKILFRFSESIDDEEVTKYGDIVRLLASFFFHADIDYSLTKIHLSKSLVTHKKIQNKNSDDSFGGLWVKLFNQSLSVGGNSSFLIRFNIIEFCMAGTKSDNAKFKSVLSDNETNKKYDYALSFLLETIDNSEHEQFRNKWKGVIKKLYYKPIDSPIKGFLENERLPVNKFPISVKRLKKIRDYLTHGSIKSVKRDELEKANKLLYGISGILILNLIGIRDWELNTDIN